MAEMALGYGSEYQLLRYLGHHRKFLDKKNKEATGCDSPIDWYDYPNEPERKSLDGEWKGIEFFQSREDYSTEDYSTIEAKWKTFWPTSGNPPSWDGIFEQGGILYIVEAKAHVKEMKSKCQASKESKDKIQEAFNKTTGNEDQARKWINSEHYQLANRLAFLHFCKTVGIEAKLCYIMFVNGFLKKKNATINVTSSDDFQKAWENECNKLDLTEDQRQHITPVFIDCSEDGFYLQNKKNKH